MRKPLAAAMLAATLLIGMPVVGRGQTEGLLDYDIPNGHFYTQTNGAPSGASNQGYSITDDYGVPFWSEFQSLGGVEQLGYPITRRFIWHGLIGQATQKAVMQWSPQAGKVQLVNVMDSLAEAGKEGWLEKERYAPPSDGRVTATDAAGVLRWLSEQGPAMEPFLRHYSAAPDPLKLFGLPTSPPHDFGDFIAIRFQRTVLQLWKVSGPGVAPGLVTSLNVGDLAKASGVLPNEVLAPQEAPPEEVRAAARQRRVSSREPSGALRGVATWYGRYFQGQEMRNGEIYDADDPSTTAANAFPLGTWLRVTNTSNGASIEVRVTDTGAFRYPIVVDLSWAAFRRLDSPGRGVIDVLVQPIHRE